MQKKLNNQKRDSALLLTKQKISKKKREKTCKLLQQHYCMSTMHNQDKKELAFPKKAIC